MVEQTAKEAGNAMLKSALRESQLRNIRLRSIESRLRDEIDDLKASWLTPKHAQKAAKLEAAQALVAGVKRDGKEEQEKFAAEMIVTPTDGAREAMKRAGMEIGKGKRE